MSVDVSTENSKTEGRTPYQDTAVNGFGDMNVAGFARQISVNVGEVVDFSVYGASVQIDIYRIGYYGGDGWRLVDTIVNTPVSQPEAQVIPDSNGATTCTNWETTASWEVPETVVSGLYVGLIRTPPESPSAPNGFYATFVVRDDDAEADIIYKTSDSTWGAAYNHYGTPSNINGKDVYGSGQGLGNILDRSYAVDYHRPVLTRGGVVQTYWQSCEQPMIRFLERLGYKVKYITCVDLDRDSSILDKGKVFISSGHDEYWSEPMRRTVESWRDNKAGRSIFMSGNEVFWRHRYVYDGDRVTLWCHKDTMPGPTGTDHNAGEPLDPLGWTGTWKDTRWADREPEWLLTGTDFRMNGVNDFDAIVPKNPYSGHKVWGGSALNDGDITLTRVIGFEADSIRSTQPNESVKILAAYTRNIDDNRADDNGQNYTEDGDLEWGIVSQRYSGGGLTVGFGTCQWSWTLDDVHLRGTGTEVSSSAQQFTVNLLNDLGATPETLPSFLSLQTPNDLDDYGLDPSDEGPEFMPNSAYFFNESKANINFANGSLATIHRKESS